MSVMTVTTAHAARMRDRDRLVQIRREPFARHDVMRERIPTADRRECSWCGQTARFRYGIESDGGTYRPVAGDFCSKGCCDTFHGGRV